MDHSGAERQLRWLMTLRVVTISTLLICAYAVELLLRPGQTLRPLFLLTAAAYALVLLYALLDRWLGGSKLLLQLQLLGDALVVTGFVAVTGGLNSPMSFLYLFPILVASMLLYRRGALVVAGACWLLYATLVALGPTSTLLPAAARNAEPEMFRIGYFLAVHLIAFVTVALLGTYLSERLRRTGDELAERTGAVARLQALNENIIESINSGLITTDAAGRVNFLNRGGSEIIGFTFEEVRGAAVEELFELEPGFLHQVEGELSRDRRFRFERWFRTPHDRRLFLGVAASNLYDRGGQPLGYIFIFQDLTEIQALEQEVQLKERVSSLGEMAAGMAHELRNPLAAISGSVQYLKGSLQPGGETLELMDIILRESQRLEQAIRDFLTFAKPGRFDPERTEIVRLVEDNLKLLAKAPWFGPQHSIRTQHDYSEMWCEVDPDRLKQVLWNLGTNALKAMPDGGALEVSLGSAAGGKSVAVSFRDEGRGMSPEELADYFQPFSSSFNEGSGLGAAIVFRLVEEHGGKIHLDSKRGAGTCVRVELPLMQSSTQRAGSAIQAAGGVR